MGEVKSAAWYDTRYNDSENTHYHESYLNSKYIKIWNNIVRLFLTNKESVIVDIGCGPGQFANLLYNNDYIHYTGFDFSKTALEIAKKKKLYGYGFVKMPIEKIISDHLLSGIKFDTVIMLETLEHIEDPLDIELIKEIPEGKQIILSVPSFDSVAHARHFFSIEEVLDRYGFFFSEIDYFIDYVGSLKKIYVLNGIKGKN